MTEEQERDEGTFYAHDADCNTVHVAGSEPCPSPREEGDSLQAALGRAWDAGHRRATSDLAAAEARGREQGRQKAATELRSRATELRQQYNVYGYPGNETAGRLLERAGALESFADFLESTGGPE